MGWTFTSVCGETSNRMLAQPYSFFEHIRDEFIANGEGFLLLAKYNRRDYRRKPFTLYLATPASTNSMHPVLKG